MRGIRFCLVAVFVVSVCAPCVFGVSSRLPRTSAGFNRTNFKRNIQTSARASTTSSIPPVLKDNGGEDDGKVRERYLFEFFEALISTLDTKLQRIENLDKAVEHLMRKVESLSTRVSGNIEKTEIVLSKLENLDSRLFRAQPSSYFSNTERPEPNIDKKLQNLETKVDGIDGKLNDLKNHFDGNGNSFLPNDEFNAEASEKKPVHMNVVEITKALNTEVINHVSKELGQLRESTSNIDRKLQFHINLVSDNLGKMLHRITDIHHAIIDSYSSNHTTTTTTTQSPIEERIAKNNKIDALTEQIKPIVTVSEKIQEVWNVVVGTKSSVDNLLPKSDELLSQTHRQERAIGEIHSDLKSKTNKIIANLDKVERRLKKQENDVANLAQGPVRAELLLDPTIDRLIEFDPKRYVEEYPETSTESYTTFYPTLAFNPQNNIVTLNQSAAAPSLTSQPLQTTTTPTDKKIEKRKDGVIFPSIKNKPGPANTTFATELLDLSKDVKGYSCVDLLNAEMRKSGVYYLQIRGTTYWFLKVYCEQQIADGGWTVIQRRDDFGDPRENFNRDWNDYKNGFGDPAKEFWLGNENIYMLTNNEEYILRVELEDFEGNRRYAQYSHFKIYSEAEYYKLEIDGYEGTAGDSLNDPWYGSNNSPFSTYNRDNDRSSLNCASMLKGGWWWKSCGRGLNGLYLNDPQDLTARQGIVWFRWRGWDYTLKKAMMMIKPKGFISSSN
ncbi:angiopoietin-1 [Harmonia axyridis]|uniref:angiopoietin-1 n=1 Tax=Harmonia axyridis TaxID=115357 RepID=UPI001E27510D|nr:angiopoietin-1 [Harmonia axyridis]